MGARLKSELLVGMESAILVEAGFKDEVDFLVMVYAPLEVRVERAVKRDCSSRELVMKRIEAQMSDEVKRSHADFVIVNDDETPLIPTGFLELYFICYLKIIITFSSAKK